MNLLAFMEKCIVSKGVCGSFSIVNLSRELSVPFVMGMRNVIGVLGSSKLRLYIFVKF